MRISVLAGAVALAVVMISPAVAHQIKVGALVIHHPWTRATPKGAEVAGGYTTIENNGDSAERLIGGTFEEAAALELHVMVMKDGVMTMRPAEGGIEIPPHGRIEFRPGGLHMMFTGLKSQLKESDEIAGTLIFEKAGSVAVDFEVQGMGSKEPVESTVHDHGTAN
jgi:copper(I)-binding protein